MKVRAICAFLYDSREVQCGDDLECDEITAKVLTAQGKVTEVIKPRRGRPPTHGRYSRRDMRAEG